MQAIHGLTYQEVFLDWFNNFLTLERFAEHYGLAEDTAAAMIEKGRAIHESLVANYKGGRRDD